MNYYDDNYKADAEYAKEVYWDSKGMGYLSNTPAVKPVYVRDTQCLKCKRWGSANAVAYHSPKCNG